ncbi:MAG: hypothetical protein WDN29_02740 [Methylovirgula sp.]
MRSTNTVRIGKQVIIFGKTGEGVSFVDAIVLEHHDEYIMRDGQRRFASLREATNVGDIDDSDHLIGLAFEYRLVDGRTEYRAIAAEAA